MCQSQGWRRRVWPFPQFTILRETVSSCLLVVEILKAKMSETDDILLTRYKIVF